MCRLGGGGGGVISAQKVLFLTLFITGFKHFFLDEFVFRQTYCLNSRPLTKINRHSIKMYNNCLSTKSGMIVID